MNKNRHKTIYGLNNCIQFLKVYKKYSIESIIISKESLSSKNEYINKIIKENHLKPTYLNKLLFNEKYNYKHHQGIIINFNGDITKNLDDINEFKPNSCYVIGDQINDPQNLGQIIRTSGCSGIDGIILPRHGSVHITNTVLQVSQGACFNVNIFLETNLSNTIKYLKSKDFWIIGIENSINSQKWYEMDYKEKTVIVIGSEGRGIRPLIKKNCDFLATIPMHGKINSLNVSAALSAILFERQRQLESS